MVCEQYQYYNNLDKLTHILQDYSINTQYFESRKNGWLVDQSDYSYQKLDPTHAHLC